jgi:hypothetical protein
LSKGAFYLLNQITGVGPPAKRGAKLAMLPIPAPAASRQAVLTATLRRISLDRASAVATAVIRIVADHNEADPHDAVTAYLRDEFHDIKQQVISEIRPESE